MEMQQQHQQQQQQQHQQHHQPQQQHGFADPFEAIAANPALRLRLELWKKEEEVVNQRTDRKEQRLNNTKNEIYQLLGIFFVFQGVILTALAQATKLKPHHWWIPFVLSTLASASTILALFYKLGDCSELQKQVDGEKMHSRALFRASDNLKQNGVYNHLDFSSQPQLSRRPQGPLSSRMRSIWDGHMQAYGASILCILFIFWAIMAASCIIIIAPESNCNCN